MKSRATKDGTPCNSNYSTRDSLYRKEPGPDVQGGFEAAGPAVTCWQSQITAP